MTEGLKRPWYRKKRGWAAGLLWLVVAYPVSVGPAAYCATRGWCGPGTFNTVYAPLVIATQSFPLLWRLLDNYARRFAEAASRHEAALELAPLD